MALTEIKTSGIADDAVTTDKLANAINTARDANTAKVTNATHTGDVTGSGSLTIADNAVTLAKMAGGTDGQIITYDASGDPIAVGPGTDGQVLTSTGAGSPPAFEDVPAGGATINNATENELVTVASTTTQLDAEANLTWDGTHMGLGLADPTPYYADRLVIQMADEDGITLASAANTLGANENNYIMFASTDSGAGRYDAYVKYSHSAHDLHIQVNEGGGSGKGFTFKNTGDFNIGDGNLVVASGHGIDFSAGSHATDMSSELLDDYEEGDFTVTLSATAGGTLGLSGNNHMKYTKIGNRVFISGAIDCNAHSSATGFLQVNGFPFTVEHDGQAADCSHIGVVYFRGGDSTPGSTGNYGDFPVIWKMHANGTSAYAQAVYGGLTDSGSQNTAQFVGESTYIWLNFSYPAA